MARPLEKHEIGSALGLEIGELQLLKENAYCWIYRTTANGSDVVVKEYKGEDPRLMMTEGSGLETYHGLVRDRPEFLDARTLALDKDRNLLCMSFVPGECFTQVVNRGRSRSSERQRAARAMNLLGKWLADLHEFSRRPGEEPDPFLFEYLLYCSDRLEKVPVLGRAAFRGMNSSARTLIDELLEARLAPSAVHGDLVFRNIHIDGDRLGLIDFANTLTHSHPLNDYYNLRIALENMVLPLDYKRELWIAFKYGLGEIEAPPAAHHFYYEWHRRRWLMLKLYGRHPRDWFQAVRGVRGCARPYERAAI